MDSLRLFKETGAFKGDITHLQKIALSIAMSYEKEKSNVTFSNFVRSVQMFINPKLYNEVYKEEIAEEQNDNHEDSGIEVDITDIESLDKYLEYAYQQTKVSNSVFSNNGQTVNLSMEL